MITEWKSSIISTRKISVNFFLIIFRLFPPTLVADLPTFINPNLGGGGVG